MCAALAGPRLADVEIVLAAVAAGAIGPAAFIDEIAMTVALSQFRIAFRGSGQRRKSCHRHGGKYEYRGCSDPDMRHANSPASLGRLRQTVARPATPTHWTRGQCNRCPHGDYAFRHRTRQSQPAEEVAMLRRFGLVIIAVATLSIAGLSPTPASAWRGGWHGGWGWGGGWGWRAGWAPGWQVGWGPAWGPGWGWRSGWAWSGPRYIVAPGFYGGGCVVRRWVRGPWGPRRILVNRCW